MSQRIFQLLYLLCISIFCNAQTNEFQEKVNQLIRTTNNYLDTNVILAEKTALELIRFTEDKKDNLFIFKSHALIASVYVKNGDFIKAEKSYKKCEEILQSKVKIDSLSRSNYYQDLGTLNIRQRKYKEALENLLISYEIKSALNIEDLGKLMSNISYLYNVDGQYEKSLEFLYKIYDYRLAKNDTLGAAKILNNIAIVSNNIGNYEKALQLTEEALQMCNNEKSEALKAKIYGTRSGTFVLTKQFKKAIECIDNKILLAKKNQLKDIEATANFEMANVLNSSGKFIAAEKYYVTSLKNARAIGYNMLIEKLYFELSNFYESRKMYKKAMEYSMTYNAFRDSLQVAQNKEYISNLKSGFENQLAKKEKELLEKDLQLKDIEIDNFQNKQKLWIFSSILLAIISIISFIFYQFRTSTNKKLAALNATKDKLFALVAHDLKNPLSAFRSITSSLIENLEVISKEDIAHFIKRLNSSSDKLFELLQNLLEWALNETGSIPYNPVRMDMLEIIEDVDELLLLSSDEKKITLENTITKNTFALGDKKMVKTVFRNLLSNAIKFTPKDGHIKISSTIHGNKIHFHINDSGIGISEADQKKLFSAGSDVNSIGNSKEKGTGLGLMLCRELINRMNGSIWVNSELNKGSTFSFALPLN